jgi:hypothetical protein
MGMRACLSYPPTLETRQGCPYYKLVIIMSYLFTWSLISPNTIFIHSNYCYITCNTKNLFSFSHWVLTCFWKTYSRAIQYVSNKPHTLFYVFALNDISFRSCFTFDSAFLDINLTPSYLFSTFNFPFLVLYWTKWT